MSFIGAAPRELQFFIYDLFKNRNKSDVFIGCSGNFTLDSVFSKLGYSVHSNDVSVYSLLIANILLKRETEISCNDPELQNVFDKWPDSYLKDFIQVLFSLRISSFYDRKNPYEQLMFDSFILKSDEYYSKTFDKLSNGAFDFSIKSFAYIDFIDFLKKKKGKGIGITYPPTYKNGYEKMFSLIDKKFDYKKAEYNIFDPDDGGIIFSDLLMSDENIICSDRHFPEIEDFIIGKIKQKNNKKDIYVYSSIESEKKYFYHKTKEIPERGLKLLPSDFSFDENTQINVSLCNIEIVNYYKDFYMSNKVDFSYGGDFGVLFFADKKVFGFASIKKLRLHNKIFLSSDFVINSETKRLSKLLIMLLLTRDTQSLFSQKLMHVYDEINTVVFTDKPVSMKYRGVFKLLKREKGLLRYCGVFSNLTVKDVYKKWLKRIK